MHTASRCTDFPELLQMISKWTELLKPYQEIESIKFTVINCLTYQQMIRSRIMDIATVWTDDNNMQVIENNEMDIKVLLSF